MTSAELVVIHADQVEAMRGTGAIFALRLDACEPQQRAWLLAHHGRVMQVLRERGRQVTSHVIVDEDGVEQITIRIVTGPHRLVLL